jgi:hypothetical protein
MNLVDKYNSRMSKIYKSLIKSGKTEFNNYDLSLLFEYYSCIQLTKEYHQNFYIYNDIQSEFKETMV